MLNIVNRIIQFIRNKLIIHESNDPRSNTTLITENHERHFSQQRTNSHGLHKVDGNKHDSTQSSSGTKQSDGAERVNGVIVFEEAINKYILQENDSEANLALCYMSGIGTKKNEDEALKLIVEGSLKNSRKALELLGDLYYCGIILEKNVILSLYISSIAKGKKLASAHQYKAMSPTVFERNSNNPDIFTKEQLHLESVLISIDIKIAFLNDKIGPIHQQTFWMDADQREYWVSEIKETLRKQKEVDSLMAYKKRPYYARMDSLTDGQVVSVYIGVDSFVSDTDPVYNVYSVWSEYGRKYRANNELRFAINGNEHSVVLKRKFDIQDSVLIKYYDEYVMGSKASEDQITDPFLLKVLDEKKGEKGISNIIRSIQHNQNTIIEHDFNRSVIVQGCAGSGKTMIMLHRLANMKYNRPNMDLSRIKIITPNHQFNLYIDELSSSLGIDKIEKLTLGEYYISILGQFRIQFQEKYLRKASFQGRDGTTIIQDETAFRASGPTEAKELQLLCDDQDVEVNILRIVYSDEFANDLRNSAINIRSEVTNVNYLSVYNRFNTEFRYALQKWGILSFPARNHLFVLYAKVLFMHTVFGAVSKNDKLLCIDEGQEISFSQYRLLYNINNAKCAINVYGDLEQRTSSFSGIYNWDALAEFISADIFELNENYRNSEEIVEYYRSKLNMNDRSFGLRTKAVTRIPLHRLFSYLQIQRILGNRTAIVCNDKARVPQDVLKLCSEEIEEDRVTLLSVIQAKGLEFDSVFVLSDQYMSRSEKYISYTRALSELYIVSE